MHGFSQAIHLRKSKWAQHVSLFIYLLLLLLLVLIVLFYVVLLLCQSIMIRVQEFVRQSFWDLPICFCTKGGMPFPASRTSVKQWFFWSIVSNVVAPLGPISFHLRSTNMGIIILSIFYRNEFKHVLDTHTHYILSGSFPPIFSQWSLQIQTLSLRVLGWW